MQVERQLSTGGISVATTASEETLSPAPQFERLPKPEANVKRAESMSVSKTHVCLTLRIRKLPIQEHPEL